MFLLVYWVQSYHEHVASILHGDTVIQLNIREIWYDGEQIE